MTRARWLIRLTCRSRCRGRAGDGGQRDGSATSRTRADQRPARAADRAGTTARPKPADETIRASGDDGLGGGDAAGPHRAGHQPTGERGDHAVGGGVERAEQEEGEQRSTPAMSHETAATTYDPSSAAWPQTSTFAWPTRSASRPIGMASER